MSAEISASIAQSTLAAQFIQPEDEPYVEAARQLLRAACLLSNRPGRPFQSYDLSFAQFDVLAALARAPVEGLSCSDIAGQTLITKSGITGLLDRLEHRGLVIRTPSHDDRRSVIVRLSARGVDYLRALFPREVRCTKSIFDAAFNRDEMRRFRELLDRVVSKMEPAASRSGL